MAKTVINPQKSLWPFVYKVMIITSDGLEELPRNKEANKWIIGLYDERFNVTERVMEDGAITYENAFSVAAVHVKGGVVLRAPVDILDFLNS